MKTESDGHGLRDSVALITGASRGIGFGIAKDLLRNGARVCITGRSKESLDEAVTALASEHVMAVPGASDDEAHREAAVEQTLERFGSLDLLVNNAGINPHYGPMIDGDVTVADKIMGVNVIAPFAWTQLAYKAWMAEHGGVVLNVSSMGGVRVARNLGFYNVSKAALIHMTRQLALELAPAVRVNAIAPAVVKTRFARKLYDGVEDSVLQGYPIGRLGAITDTASAARFLLSDEASWITGHTLILDGGMSLVGWETPQE
ncbi:MAG: glucose 1-dehydrogenase [Propionibacteriales bacterium]|nr:glucose 1-dehydrogenase [Propionibacteriales bacterium]